MREIMELADEANRYIDRHKPWALAKDPARAEEARAIATQGINLFRVLMSYLTPVLPRMAQTAGEFLDVNFDDWERIRRPLLSRRIRPYQALARRLDAAAVASLVERPVPEDSIAQAAPAGEARPAAAAQAASAAADASASSKRPQMVGIEDFSKLDLRVARVERAEAVEGSQKLIKLTLDLGNERRTVFSGIRASYAPEQLIGRMVIVIANLAPRKMRFGTSEGMVLSASSEAGERALLLSVDADALPGMHVS